MACLWRALNTISSSMCRFGPVSKPLLVLPSLGVRLFMFLLWTLPPSFVPSFLRSFVPSFLRSFVPSFLRSFVPSFLRSFVPSFLRSFVPSFLRSFVPSFLRSFVPSLPVSADSFDMFDVTGKCTTLKVTASKPVSVFLLEEDAVEMFENRNNFFYLSEYGCPSANGKVSGCLHMRPFSLYQVFMFFVRSFVPFLCRLPLSPSFVPSFLYPVTFLCFLHLSIL